MSAPALPTREQLNARMKEIDELWSSKNLDKVFENYDDNIRYTDLGLGLINLDKKALRSFMDRSLECVADMKMQHSSLNVVADGSEIRLFSEFRITGKYVKDVAEFGRPATGKEMVCVGSTFTTLAPGSDKALKMTHYNRYYFDGDAPESEAVTVGA